MTYGRLEKKIRPSAQLAPRVVYCAVSQTLLSFHRVSSTVILFCRNIYLNILDLSINWSGIVCRLRRVRQAAKPVLAQPASPSAQVVEKTRLGRGLSRPAPARKAEPGKADRHHRPGRGFGHRASADRLYDDRTIAKSLAVASRANGQDKSTNETGRPSIGAASRGVILY